MVIPSIVFKNNQSVRVGAYTLEIVKEFKYLGKFITITKIIKI